MQVMLCRSEKQRLSDLVQMDEAYPGGERSGGKRGCGADETTPFVAVGIHVVSDDLECLDAVPQAGCAHEAVISDGGRAAMKKPQFYWINTIRNNFKTALRNNCHFFDPKYTQYYLMEFEFRFNRVYSLLDLLLGKLRRVRESSVLTLRDMIVREATSH